jgi:dTDP-4-dehydrorhamnose 3,5-epimerase
MAAPDNPFTVLPSGAEGLLVLQPRVFRDPRGSFIKTFHSEAFRSLGIDFTPREEFYSVSHRNVVRGMHFQVPPAAHHKLVYCLAGRVLDVVVDLRRSSVTYGKAFSRELTGAQPELLSIPIGFAHGFAALEDNSILVYQTDTAHSPVCDAGVLWSSLDFCWPVSDPILSNRDRGFPPLGEFQTPFA